MNIVNVFFEAAQDHPTHLALRHGKEEVTYQELEQKVQNYAQWLEGKKVASGSKVLVFVPMSIELYATVLALMSIGAVVVFVDEWSKIARVKQAISLVGADAIILPAWMKWLSYLVAPFLGVKKRLSPPNRIALHNYVPREMDADHTALITFTTGSTGVPKAANRTHGFLQEQFDVLSKEIGALPSDNCLVTLPIVLLSILGTGATGHIPIFDQKNMQNLKAEPHSSYIENMGITMIIASPYFIHSIAKLNVDHKKIRKVLTGGAPVFPAVADDIVRSFSNAQADVAYGSTEAEPISTIDMKSLLQIDSNLTNGLPVGQLNPAAEVAIIKYLPCPIELEHTSWSGLLMEPGEVGEIIVAGPHVLSSYYQSHEAFARNKIVDGDKIWHRTGDSGRLLDGSLYLLGRCESLIIKDGDILSPFIIENRLQSMEEVVSGTILEMDDQVVVAVQPKEEYQKQKLVAKITNVFNFDCHVRFVDKMPLDPRHFGKIDYQGLRELIEQY